MQYPKHDSGASFGIGQGVVVVGEFVAAVGGYGVKLVVFESFEEAAREAVGAVETVVRVRNAVMFVQGFEATFVEGAVVRHEGQSFEAGGNFRPHFGKGGSVRRVPFGESVHKGVAVGIEVRFGTDKAV